MQNLWEGLRASRQMTPEEELAQLFGQNASNPPLAAQGSIPDLAEMTRQVRAARGNPVKAKAEGIKTTDEQTVQTDQKRATTRNIYADPSDLEKMRLAQESDPYLQSQISGEKRLENLLAMELAMPADTGSAILRPLAALADSETGSKLMAGLPVTEAPHARNQRLMTMAEKLQDNRRDIASKAAESARNLKTGTVMDLLLAQLTDKKGATAGGGGNGTTKNPQVNNAYEKIWDQFAKDKVAGKALTQLQFVPDAQAMLTNQNSISDEMLKRALLNLAHDTRPSDRDVQAFGGDRRVLNRAQQAWDWAFGTGSFTPLNRTEIEAIIGGFTRVAKQRFVQSAKTNSRAGKRAHPELPSESEIEKFIYDRAGYTPDEMSKPVETANDQKLKQLKAITDELKKLKSE